MSRKQIAVVAQGYKEIFGVKHNYMQFMYQFGDVHVATHLSSVESLRNMDLVVLPGGPDVNPRRYGQKKEWYSSDPEGFLEEFDQGILPELIGQVPIFGICRGLQTLNVHFGGTLHQDILYYKNKGAHPVSNNEGDLAHNVTIAKEYTLKVNSFHHQAIDSLAPSFSVEAVSEDDYIEAIQNEELKIFAVQWHPERMVKDEYSISAIGRLLKD